MRRLLTAVLWVAGTMTALAQTDPEYKMEIGGGVGMMSYEGDFNGSLLKDMQPTASVLLRRAFNPWLGLKFNATYGKLKGSSADVETYYPFHHDPPYEFSNTAVDVGAMCEYNLWPYGTGRDYRGAKRFTPFIGVGLGLTYAHADKEVFTANLPVGIGLKYKVAPRLNLGMEWAVHISLSDKLDGAPDPYGIVSSGAFKNTDCYSALQVTLTYSFLEKCRTCHNEDE